MNVSLNIPDWVLITIFVLFGIKTALELVNAWLDYRLKKAREDERP